METRFVKVSRKLRAIEKWPFMLHFQVFMHGHSMVSVYKSIDMSLLPEEYLPDDFDGKCAGNIKDITGSSFFPDLFF